MDASHSSPPSIEGTPGQRAPEDDPHQPVNGLSFLDRIRSRAARLIAPESDVAEGEPHRPVHDRRPASEAERIMVNNIRRLRDLRVEDVMTPRADIVAVEVDTPLPEVTDAFERGGFSRLPVYRETLDEPIGFVHLKDLALKYGVGCAREPEGFRLANHLRPALFVPPSMGVAVLLQKMQAERIHMALVIDEFGGVDGLVTIEDLVEQIVGDIEDEHDEEEVDLWRSTAPGVYIVNARSDIAEFEQAEGIELRPDDWEEEVDTLGGLVFMLTGRVPARGEVIAHPGGHEFEIMDADPRRIKRMRLTVNGTSRQRLLPKAAE